MTKKFSLRKCTDFSQIVKCFVNFCDFEHNGKIFKKFHVILKVLRFKQSIKAGEFPPTAIYQVRSKHHHENTTPRAGKFKAQFCAPTFIVYLSSMCRSSSSCQRRCLPLCRAPGPSQARATSSPTEKAKQLETTTSTTPSGTSPTPPSTLTLKVMNVYSEIKSAGEAAWIAEWLGRRPHDQKIVGSIPDPGSQTVV